MKVLTKILIKSHPVWSAILPRFFRAYKLPTGGSVYIDITESPMMFSRIHGLFEPEKHRAYDYFLKPGDAYIDIGSNKGDFAIHAAIKVGETGRVLAFEPEPENCKWISRSIEKSKLKNIHLEQAAVGAEDGSLNLFIGKRSGWHSLVANNQHTNEGSIPVDVYPLDRYLQENPLENIKAIKIDVEGFEKEVLLGARETLSSIKDLVMFLDIHPTHGVIHEEIYDLLQGYGFSLFHEEYPYDRPVGMDETPTEIIAIKRPER